MLHFPNRLKAARKMKGWSLQELSDKMNNLVSKQALSFYEAGDIKPTSDVLMALCRALEVSVDFFEREEKVEIEKISFRKLKKLAQKEQERVVASTQDFINRYLELENMLNITSAARLPRCKVSKDGDVEKAANKLREDWELGSDPLANVIELLEDHNIKVFEIQADRSFNGMSAWIEKKIPVIVINSSEELPLDRKRFTALHELGHLCMDIDHYEEKDQEKLCNRFAAAMLIPRDILLNEIGGSRGRIFISELGQLKMQYGISIMALIYRMKDLELITESHHKQLMAIFGRMGMRTHEPEAYDYKGQEKSHRFIQLLLRGVAEEIISTSKAAALNNQKLPDFRKLLA
jgi:Zn-dependent peptidase ImmA (M78 family)